MLKLINLIYTSKLYVLYIALLLVSNASLALPQDNMKLIGEAKFSFAFWPVYRAKLFSLTTNFNYSQGQPFVFEVTYSRDITKNAFIKETKKQWTEMGIFDEELINSSLIELSSILVSVNKDDMLSLYVDDHYSSHFYFNNRFLGNIENPIFSKMFSAIWLSEKTTRPNFRKKLLENIL